MQWPKDTTEAKNAFYGDFHTKGWQDLNLTRYTPPFTMWYGTTVMTHGLLVHRKIVPALAAAFDEIWNGGLRQQAVMDKLGVSSWGGCFNIRQIAGSENYSNHSWACAVDLDPAHNGFNTGHGHMQPIVINAFKRQGALWGGDYHGRTDPMHFEFVSR